MDQKEISRQELVKLLESGILELEEHDLILRPRAMMHASDKVKKERFKHTKLRATGFLEELDDNRLSKYDIHWDSNICRYYTEVSAESEDVHVIIPDISVYEREELKAVKDNFMEERDELFIDNGDLHAIFHSVKRGDDA